MITIIGNVNNAGFALPMVQAYPTDPNSAQLLAWNPTAQALDYVPYTGSTLGDFGVVRDLAVGRDLAVTRNASIGGTLGVTGVLTTQLAAPAVIPSIASNLAITGNTSVTGTISGSSTITATTATRALSGGNTGSLEPTQLTFNATKVLGPRITGWAAATGTATRSTFATGSVTLPVLAEHVKALIDDLMTHGLINV